MKQRIGRFMIGISGAMLLIGVLWAGGTALLESQSAQALTIVEDVGAAVDAQGVPSRLSLVINLTVLGQSLVWVSVGPFDVTMEQGGVATLPLTLRNDGVDPVTYIFISTPPEGVPIVVLLQDSAYTRTIAPGALDTLNLEILVDASVPPAVYTVEVDLV